MMAKRPDGKIKDNVSGEHTFGHNLLTLENVRRLADCATHWAIAMNFENDEMVPKHNFFRAEYMINLFEQGKLCRATLIAGITTKREPPKPVPAPFFRTLDFLLQYVCGGNVYRPITDKDYSKGVPPAAWCRVPVVAATEDAAAATAVAVQHASAAELERIPPTHPIRFFFSSRCWCVVTAFHITASSVKVNIGVPADVMYDAYMDGKVSDYALVVGLTDAAPPGNLWVPPCVMQPLGALLYTHGAGRPYLPLSLNELRDVRGSGVLSLGARKDVRPLPLPPGIQPREDPAAAAAAAEAEAALLRAAADAEAEEARARSASAVAVPSGRASDGMISGGGTSGRSNSRSTSSSSMAAAGGSGGGISAQSSGGGPANGGTVAPPPPPPFPDPLLHSAKWIMPQPFDTPLPPPPQPPSDSSAAADGNGGNGGTASSSSPTPPAAVAVPALAPSPYLGELNHGVQTHFETPPMRLFMGERAQLALAANWWYIDSETGVVHGPYSPEQMVLSFCAGCRELAEETRVCGTDADVRPPLQPPPAAFLPLSHLMQEINDGAIYMLVSRADILSPLGHRFLGTRTRQPPPPQLEAPQPTATAAALSPPPIVVTVQQQPSLAQPQQPLVYQPHKPPGLVVAAAPSSGAPSPLTLPQGAGTAAAAAVQPLAHAALQPTQTQTKPQQPAVYQPPTAPTVVAAVPVPTAVPHVVRALPLASHPLQTRPMMAAAPAYIMPGALMCMPPYGSMAMAYSGQAVVAQPVLGTAAALPQPPPKPQQ